MLKKIIIGIIIIIILSFAGCKYIVKGALNLAVGKLTDRGLEECEKNNNASACLMLVIIYSNESLANIGLKKDLEKMNYYMNKAEQLAHKKCYGNNIEGCTELFIVYLLKDNVQQAKALLPRICISGQNKVDDKTLIFIKNICKYDTIQRFEQINKQDISAKMEFLVKLMHK
jgi:hypothetical protein